MNLYLEPRVKGPIWANSGRILATRPTAKFYLAKPAANAVVVHELHPALWVDRHFQYAGLGRFILGHLTTFSTTTYHIPNYN
jgi:hypothetical protein